MIEEKTYTFTVELRGDGIDPQDAWADAVEKLALDPGINPDEYKEEPME